MHGMMFMTKSGASGQAPAVAPAVASAKALAKNRAAQKWEWSGCTVENVCTPAQLNGLVWAICSICHTELAHDVRLSMLESSRRGPAGSASAGAKRVRSGLRGRMEKDSKKGATHEFTAPVPD